MFNNMSLEMWRRLAIWKAKERLEGELFFDGDCGVKDKYKSFDLAVLCIVKVSGFYGGSEVVAKKLVKAMASVRHNLLMKCLEDAFKIWERQKKAWSYLDIIWVTPNLETARHLHYVLKRVETAIAEFRRAAITSKIFVWNDTGIDGQNKFYEAKAVKIEERTYVDNDEPVHEITYVENDNPDAMVLFDIASGEEVRRLPYNYPYLGTYEKKIAEPLRVRGLKARNLGVLKQREVYKEVCREMRKKGYRVIYSEKYGVPDMLVIDDHNRVVEVIAVKAYSLEVTTGKGCRNVKSRKYAVSFNPRRDAKAECRAALQNGLDKIRLIFINLKTDNKIFDGFVGLDETVTIREYSKDQNPN